MGIKIFLVMMVLDIAMAAISPCYTSSDQTKFDEITRSLQTAQSDLSALRLDYSNRVPTECEQGWTRYKDHCYIYKPIEKSWSDAVKSCSDEGGSLVYIYDDDENSWVSNLCPGAYCWIGAHDQIKEGDWLWSHNWVKVTFTKWNTLATPIEPNGGTDENCVMVYGRTETVFKKWNDLSCDRKLHYICKMAAKRGCD